MRGGRGGVELIFLVFFLVYEFKQQFYTTSVASGAWPPSTDLKQATVCVLYHIMLHYIFLYLLYYDNSIQECVLHYIYIILYLPALRDLLHAAYIHGQINLEQCSQM